MTPASLTYGAGPGSTITLTAETIRVRDAIIDKFADKSLAELNSFIETALGTEKDENKRLGILAARVYILRMRMRNITDPNQQTVAELTPADMIRTKDAAEAQGPEEQDERLPDSAYEEWNELVIIEAGEINGVRIPKGVTITVGLDDARRLIETKKAVFASSSSQNGDPQKSQPPEQAETATADEDILVSSTDEEPSPPQEEAVLTASTDENASSPQEADERADVQAEDTESLESPEADPESEAETGADMPQNAESATSETSQEETDGAPKQD
jgi:hypothetical protein